jgi:TPR repeat protein
MQRRHTKLLHATLTASLVLVAIAASTVAEPLEDARAAYGRGEYATALRLILPLAEQGIAAAQNGLGVMYNQGQGVPQDYAEAMKWYRLAADQSYAKAQSNLATMYHDGEGVPQDYAEAMKWYRLATDQADTAAHFNLGLMYYRGEGVRPDYAEAMKWFRLAADQGDANAQNNLGVMYLKGQGVPQNYNVALGWFNVSAAQGHQEAIRNRDSANRQIKSIDPDHIPGHTTANVELKRDIVRTLNLLELGAKVDCAEPRKVIDTERVEVQRNTRTVVERWTVSRCGKPIKYVVKQTALPQGDPRGRTLVEVTAEK